MSDQDSKSDNNSHSTQSMSNENSIIVDTYDNNNT